VVRLRDGTKLVIVAVGLVACDDAEPRPVAPSPSATAVATSTAAVNDGTATSSPTESGSSLPIASSLLIPPAPEGWMVIEHGDVRVSVPPGWTSANCDGRPEQRTVTLCDRNGFSATVGPGKLDSYGTGSQRRHGLAYVTMLIECAMGPDDVIVPCEAIELVDLDVRVDVVAPDYETVDKILESVGVSEQWRAANEPDN